MFHLFKRVYLAFDTTDPGDAHAGILSAREVPVATQKMREGKLLFYATEPSLLGDFSTIIHQLSQLKDRAVVLCDAASLAWLMKTWFATLFTEQSSYSLYRSYVLRYQYFYQNFFSRGPHEPHKPHEPRHFKPVSRDHYDQLQIPKALTPWPIARAHELSVEFLLANYVMDGSYKDELKKAILPLLRKDLEKYLYELKEILYVHLLHETFVKQFGLKRKYTFENFDELLLAETHPAICVFLDPKVWITEGMAPQSSGKNICLEKITPEHVKAFRQFNDFAGGRWEEEKVYQFVKSDIHKLDFLELLHNFTDEGLEKLLEVESSFQNAAGSFFSIDLVTVNHYLVNHILNLRNHGKTEELAWLKLRTQ